MNSEFKRMIKLAGLTEIKITKPKHFLKLNLPFNSTNSNTLIPVNEFEKNFENLIEDLTRLNPQIHPKFFWPHLSSIDEDVEYALSTDYPEGATLKQFYEIYFEWLWANLVANYGEYSDEEVDARDEQYGHMREEFTDYAITGKWLVVDGVTA